MMTRFSFSTNLILCLSLFLMLSVVNYVVSNFYIKITKYIYLLVVLFANVNFANVNWDTSVKVHFLVLRFWCFPIAFSLFTSITIVFSFPLMVIKIPLLLVVPSFLKILYSGIWICSSFVRWVSGKHISVAS